MGILSGNHDWNGDGKIDWQDDALFHEEIYNDGNKGGSSGNSPGSCSGCLGSILAVAAGFALLALLFGHI